MKDYSKEIQDGDGDGFIYDGTEHERPVNEILQEEQEKEAKKVTKEQAAKLESLSVSDPHTQGEIVALAEQLNHESMNGGLARAYDTQEAKDAALAHRRKVIASLGLGGKRALDSYRMYDFAQRAAEGYVAESGKLEGAADSDAADRVRDGMSSLAHLYNHDVLAQEFQTDLWGAVKSKLDGVDVGSLTDGDLKTLQALSLSGDSYEDYMAYKDESTKRANAVEGSSESKLHKMGMNETNDSPMVFADEAADLRDFDPETHEASGEYRKVADLWQDQVGGTAYRRDEYFDPESGAVVANSDTRKKVKALVVDEVSAKLRDEMENRGITEDQMLGLYKAIDNSSNETLIALRNSRSNTAEKGLRIMIEDTRESASDKIISEVPDVPMVHPDESIVDYEEVDFDAIRDEINEIEDRNSGSPASGSEDHSRYEALSSAADIARNEMVGNADYHRVKEGSEASGILADNAVGLLSRSGPKNVLWDATDALVEDARFNGGVSMSAQAVAATMNYAWASTSTGDGPSVAMQMAVAEEISGKPDTTIEPARREAIDEAKLIMSEHGDSLKAVARATYQATQEELAMRGIENVLLFRGVRIPLKSLPSSDGMNQAVEIINARRAVSPNGTSYHVTDDKIEGNPISSWSTDYDTANDFANYGSSKGVASVLYSAIVPASSIYSTAATGPGCLTEAEMIVLPLNEEVPAKAVTSFSVGDDDSFATLSNPSSADQYLEVVRESGSVGGDSGNKEGTSDES